MTRTPSFPTKRDRHATPWIIVAAALWLTGLSACGGPSAEYISHQESGSFLKLPSGWTVFDKSELHPTTSSTSGRDRTIFEAGFDSADPPSYTRAINDLASNTPAGIFRVRRILSAGSFRLNEMRNELLPLDNWITDGRAQELIDPPIKVSKDKNATGLLLNYVVSINGRDETYVQQVMVDAGLNYAYTLLIHCSDACFRAEIDDINGILRSWKIKGLT